MGYYRFSRRVPATMPKRETAMLVSLLKEIRETATMKTANFYVFDPDSDQKMDELRKLTRVWRRSWLIAPLDDIIERSTVT